MFLLGVATFYVRYKGQGSPLIQVLRRDGGLYYMSMLGEPFNLPSWPARLAHHKRQHSV